MLHIPHSSHGSRQFSGCLHAPEDRVCFCWTRHTQTHTHTRTLNKHLGGTTSLSTHTHIHTHTHTHTNPSKHHPLRLFIPLCLHTEGDSVARLPWKPGPVYQPALPLADCGSRVFVCVWWVTVHLRRCVWDCKAYTGLCFEFLKERLK